MGKTEERLLVVLRVHSHRGRNLDESPARYHLGCTGCGSQLTCRHPCLDCMGRLFSHVKAWGGTAQITTQGHRGTFFRVVFRYLATAALSFSGRRHPVGVAIRSREDHPDEKITHHEVGWSPLRNHPINVRGGQVSDWEESQMLAALAFVSYPRLCSDGAPQTAHDIGKTGLQGLPTSSPIERMKS
jgi:hypothetical protein